MRQYCTVHILYVCIALSGTDRLSRHHSGGTSKLRLDTVESTVYHFTALYNAQHIRLAKQLTLRLALRATFAAMSDTRAKNVAAAQAAALNAHTNAKNLLATAEEHARAVEEAGAAQLHLQQATAKAKAKANPRGKITVGRKLTILRQLGYAGQGKWAPPAVDEEGKPWTMRSLATSYEVPRSCISQWKKDVLKIEDAVCSGGDGTAKSALRSRMRTSVFEDVDKALAAFVESARVAENQCAKFTGSVLKEKARSIAADMADRMEAELQSSEHQPAERVSEAQDEERAEAGISVDDAATEAVRDRVRALRSFKASEGWLNTWKQRYGFRSERGSGKGGNALPAQTAAEMLALQKETAPIVDQTVAFTLRAARGQGVDDTTEPSNSECGEPKRPPPSVREVLDAMRQLREVLERLEEHNTISAERLRLKEILLRAEKALRAETAPRKQQAKRDGLLRKSASKRPKYASSGDNA